MHFHFTSSADRGRVLSYHSFYIPNGSILINNRSIVGCRKGDLSQCFPNSSDGRVWLKRKKVLATARAGALWGGSLIADAYRNMYLQRLFSALHLEDDNVTRHTLLDVMAQIGEREY